MYFYKNSWVRYQLEKVPKSFSKVLCTLDKVLKQWKYMSVVNKHIMAKTFDYNVSYTDIVVI